MYDTIDYKHPIACCHIKLVRIKTPTLEPTVVSHSSRRLEQVVENEQKVDEVQVIPQDLKEIFGEYLSDEQVKELVLS